MWKQGINSKLLNLQSNNNLRLKNPKKKNLLKSSLTQIILKFTLKNSFMNFSLFKAQ